MQILEIVLMLLCGNALKKTLKLCYLTFTAVEGHKKKITPFFKRLNAQVKVAPM